MKAAIAFSLVTAAAALPAPQAVQIAAATTCPDLNGAQVTSNNFQPYELHCNEYIDCDTPLRITSVEQGGYTSCLTACDGTLGCAAVQYIASNKAQTKGSCTLYPEGYTTRYTDSPSYLVATPIARPSEPKRFVGIALRQGSPIHISPVNANGLRLYLDKNTTTSCPSGVEGLDCALYNTKDTIFLQGADSDTLSLDVAVPGGQQVYVTEGDKKTGQLAGQLRFTPAHSGATAGPALYNGFSVDLADNLLFEGNAWFACEVDDFNSGYGIWSISRLEGSNAGANCIEFTLRVAEVGDALPSAWQYN